MNLLDSLLDALVRLDGDALVMHVGEKPYVVTTSAAMNEFRGPLAWGQVELSSRVLTPEAVLGMLGQILPLPERHALEEYGAVEHEIHSYNTTGRFTVIAARGGDDVWLELRRHQVAPEAAVGAAAPAPTETTEAEVATPVASTVPDAPTGAIEEVEDFRSAPASREEPAPIVTTDVEHVEEPVPFVAPVVEQVEVPAPFVASHVEHVDEPAPFVPADVEQVEEPAPVDVPPAHMDAPEPFEIPASHFEEPMPVDVPAVHFEDTALAEAVQEYAEEPAAFELDVDEPSPLEPVHVEPDEPSIAEPFYLHADEPASIEYVSPPEDEPVIPVESSFEFEAPLSKVAAIEIEEEDDEDVELTFGLTSPSMTEAVAPHADEARDAPFEIVHEVSQHAPTDDDVDALLAASAAALLQSGPATHAPADIGDGLLPTIDEAPELGFAFDLESALAAAAAIGHAEPEPFISREELELSIALHGAPLAPDADAIAAEPEPQPDLAEPLAPALEPEPEIELAAEIEEEQVPSDPFADLESGAIARETIDIIPPPQPEPSPAVAETEPQPVAAAAESPSAAAEPEAVHVVERETPPIPAVTFDTQPPQPEPVPVVAEAEPQPVTLAQDPAVERAVVLPLSRRATRHEPPTTTAPHASPVFSIDELLRVAAARGASTVYIVAQSRPMVRADGEINVLEIGPGTPLAEADIDRLMLDMAPAAAREAWQRGQTAEWMCDFDDVGRVRCMTFRDHRGPGLIFRMIPPQAISADQLGLTPEVQALCAQSDGLVLITGPRASGKSTLMASFVDLINRTRSDHVVTIESQIGFVHESRRSFISQREVREGESVASGVRGALREDPDVLFISDLRSAEIASAAVEAAESGRLVVASLPAASTVAAVDRMLELLPAGRRSQAQASLAASLRGVVAQVLVRRIRGGRVAAREVLLNTAAVASLIQEAKTAQLPLAIESGRRHGMMPLNDALAAFVRDGTVHVTEAYRKAFDKQALLTALRRDGIDTSFAEKLA